MHHSLLSRLACLPAAGGMLSAFLLLAGCGSSGAAGDPYGLWKGKLAPREGYCQQTGNAWLAIKGREIVFTPGDSAQVLKGTYHSPASIYTAELHEPGMNGHPFNLVFIGHPAGKTIQGTFGTSRCRASVTFHRDNGASDWIFSSKSGFFSR